MAITTTQQIFNLSKVYVLYDKDGNRVTSFTDDPDHVRGLYNSEPTLVETSSVDTGANTNVTLQRLVAIPDDNERQRFSENQGLVNGGIVRGKLMGIVAPYHEPFRLPYIADTLTASLNTKVYSGEVTFENVPENTQLNLRGLGEAYRVIGGNRQTTPLTLPYTIPEGDVIQFSASSPNVASGINRIEILIGEDTTYWNIVTTPVATRREVQEVGKSNSTGFTPYLPAGVSNSDVSDYDYFVDHNEDIDAEVRPGGITFNFLRQGEVDVTVDSYPKNPLAFGKDYYSVTRTWGNQDYTVYTDSSGVAMARDDGEVAVVLNDIELGRISSEAFYNLPQRNYGRAQGLHPSNFIRIYGQNNDQIWVMRSRTNTVRLVYLGSAGSKKIEIAQIVPALGKRTYVTCQGTPHVSSDREVRKTDTRIAGIVLYRGMEYCEQDLTPYFDSSGSTPSVTSTSDVTTSLTNFKLRITPKDTSSASIATNEITITQGSNVKTISIEVYPKKQTARNLNDVNVIQRDLAVNAGLSYFYTLEDYDWTEWNGTDNDQLMNELEFSLLTTATDVGQSDGSVISRIAIADGTKVDVAKYELVDLTTETYDTLKITGINAGRGTCRIGIRNTAESEALPNVQKSVVVRDVRGYIDTTDPDDLYTVDQQAWVDTPVPSEKLASENVLPTLPNINGMPVKLIYAQDGILPEFTLDAENRVRIDERDPVVSLQMKDAENDLNSSVLFKYVNQMSSDENILEWPKIED